jgi:hypothetical protein
MWMQQKRVWDNKKKYSDPFLGFPIPISLLDSRSPGSREGGAPALSGPEMIALHGPPPRNNESIHLGASLANPNTIAVDDDEGGGFEEVLDLYRGAVQGSTLSMELELAVGGDAGLVGVGWETASSLEVSVGCGSGEPQESRIRTLAEYRRVVEAEKAVSPDPINATIRDYHSMAVPVRSFSANVFSKRGSSPCSMRSYNRWST